MKDIKIIAHNNKICSKRIVFLSDLHFDFVKDSTKESGRRFAPEYSENIQAAFINYIKKNHMGDILLLGGDFYNNRHKALEFVKALESNKILGFFVLGNHDYWNNGILSHEQIFEIFNKETAEHNFFKFLKTGKKYYIDDLCFIGDTGWTSFKRTVGRFTENESEQQVSLKQFMLLPDAKYVRGFNPKKIRAFHNAWIEFANTILTQEQKTIILTHFPMFDLTKEDRDCWWSSKTQLLNTENQWRVFGHTHHERKHAHGLNLSSQRGYKNRIIKTDTPDLYEEVKTTLYKELQERRERVLQYRKSNNLSIAVVQRDIIVREEEIQAEKEKQLHQYLPEDFGILYKASDRRELSIPFQNVMSRFYTSALVAEGEDSIFSRSVKYGGYKRSSANKVNLAHLAQDKEAYLKRVREEIESTANAGQVRIGYYYSYNFKQETIEALNTAADYLEHNDISNDVRAFITAAVITGYAWNSCLSDIEGMRPVNDYDVARFFMQFITMQKLNIPFNEICSIQRSKKDKVLFMNMELWLPMINGQQLERSQIILELQATPLIDYVSSAPMHGIYPLER